MPNRMDKLHLYICIVAAFIVTIIGIVRNESLYRLSIWVTLTIVIFYILGQITRFYLANKVFPTINEDTDPAEEKEEDEKAFDDESDDPEEPVLDEKYDNAHT